MVNRVMNDNQTGLQNQQATRLMTPFNGTSLMLYNTRYFDCCIDSCRFAARTRRSELKSSIVTVSGLLNTAILVFFSVYQVPYLVKPIKHGTSLKSWLILLPCCHRRYAQPFVCLPDTLCIQYRFINLFSVSINSFGSSYIVVSLKMTGTPNSQRVVSNAPSGLMADYSRYKALWFYKNVLGSGNGLCIMQKPIVLFFSTIFWIAIFQILLLSLQTRMAMAIQTRMISFAWLW